MKRLEKEFSKKGFYFKLLKRVKNIALYQMSPKENPDIIYGYDVVKIRVLPKATIMGNEVPEREIYPKDEDFGRFGWCFNKEKNAIEYFNKIT